MSIKKKELFVRPTQLEDALELKKWLLDQEVAPYFPMQDQVEIEDAANRWVGFCRYRCSLTAVEDDHPIGLCTLYLQPYRKLMHQSEFGIIVSPTHRGSGIGTRMLKALFELAKRDFSLSLIHLQVYQGNPAIRLYERMGFREFGRQSKWIKESNGSYRGRIFMEKDI